MSRRKVYAWALYDWANSAFATTVMAGFFPVFFKEFWSAGTSATQSTFHLGMVSSAQSVVIAVLAPVLGAIADRGSAKKRFLFAFTALGVTATALLAAVGRGDWQAAAALYGVASLGFAGALVFYDALLVAVAGEGEVDLVSALGYALGYLGGGLLFSVNVAMTLRPALFGLANAAEAVRWSFVGVALWWALFSIPLFRGVPEPSGGSVGGWEAVCGGWRQVVETFGQVRRLRVVVLFLAGYWLYIDAVDTVIRMAVDYGMSIGFRSQDLILALLITQFVGFPAALVFGKLGKRLGAKRGILIGLAVYLGVTVWGALMRRPAEFYALAVVIGLVQGGVQSLSRSFYARLIPQTKAAEFFGFYNMLGKFAAVIGPLLMGWVALATGDPRRSILSLSLLFLLGGLALWGVDEAEGVRAAKAMEEP